MSERRGIGFKVGGIEDGMTAALVTYCADYKPDVATYGGELDEQNLREAIAALSPRFPLYLVSYFDGKDVLLSPLGPEVGAPCEYQHDCVFSVICCHDNARGETERRRGATGSVGVYDMLEDSDAAVAGMQFVALVDGEKILLNTQPLTPVSIQYLMELPELTAYARHYSTAFRHTTPDRREPGQQVLEIEIEIFPGGAGASRPAKLPGVTLKLD